MMLSRRTFALTSLGLAAAATLAACSSKSKDEATEEGKMALIVSDAGDAAAEALAWNPHIKFNNDLRGYLRVDLSAQLLEARFRVVDYVSELGSSVRTRAVFGVGDGEHQLHRIA